MAVTVGGHDTAPWLHFGGRRAADLHAERNGRPPKTDFGRSHHTCSVARMIRWMKVAEAAGRLGVVEVLPRYNPRWTRWVVNIPGVREVASWDAVLVARSR